MRVKKIAIGLAVLMALLAVGGCGSKDGDSNAKCSDVVKSTLEAVDTTQVDTTTIIGEDTYDKNFENLYNFSIDKISDGAIAFSGVGTYADEISIVKVKDSNDISDVKTYMENRLERRAQDFENYLPKEAGKVKNGEVMVQKEYVILIIAKDVEDIRNEIKKAIG